MPQSRLTAIVPWVVGRKVQKSNLERKMKIIIAIFMLAAAITANAALPFCEGMGMLGAVVMQERQAGKPPSHAMKVVKKIDPKMEGMANVLIEMAYDRPRYISPEMQQRSIDDMKSEMEIICLRSK